MLGTLTLPLLTPLSRIYLLEPLGIVEKDRLNWEKKFQSGQVPNQDGIAIAGLFAVTISMAAFSGLQWKPKVWAIAFLGGGLIYLTLMTSFWTNMNGLLSGCLLYTSDAADERSSVDLGGSRIIKKKKQKKKQTREE